ncbi:tyrosine-type recombinase/integrase [Nocardia sp. SC052]|uniref:tyrosine-type recombinase/integrase n=1 Tax=Nocardia sichangensis TaxID=3385975 RepID=UPI0039A2C258
MAGFGGSVPGAARLHLVDGVSLLRPEEQVFEAMLAGFANQQLARNLAHTTVEGREKTVKAFTAYVNAFPWQWTPAMIDEWLGDLRSLRDLKRSTIRSYSEAIRSFCHFVTDPLYEWPATCENRFGTHPIQIVHEWNTAVHVQDNESDPKKRAFTKAELHAFFEHADNQVARIRAFGRKGWLPAFRDATLFKTAYSFDLRRNEIRMLDAADFGRQPARTRVRRVRPLPGPLRQGEEGIATETPRCVDSLGLDRRGPRRVVHRHPPVVRCRRQPGGLAVRARAADRLSAPEPRFAAYRDALGLDAGLDLHSLRRSYVTHLIEDGWDPRFVQEQVGHEHASTTSIYTCVSSDFRTRTLRRQLDATVTAALESRKEILNEVVNPAGSV